MTGAAPTSSGAAAGEVETDLARLDLEVARRIAEAAFAAASAPVVVRVETPQQCVLHAAQTGTNRFNDEAVVRKARTVLALGRSTSSWNRRLTERGLSASIHPLVDAAAYTDIPGGIPLTVAGHLVGALAISGLAPADDHALALEALATVTG